MVMSDQELTLSLAFLAGLLSFLSPCILPLVPAYLGFLRGASVMTGEQASTRRETITSFIHAWLFVLGFSLVFVLFGASATFIGQLVQTYAVGLQRVGGVLLILLGVRLMSTNWNLKHWVGAAVLVALGTLTLQSGFLAGGRVEGMESSLLWLAEGGMVGLVVLAGAGRSLGPTVALAVAAGFFHSLISMEPFYPNLLASSLIALVTIILHRTEVFYTERRFELRHLQPTNYVYSLLLGVVFAAGWTPCVGPILAAILGIASQLQTVSQGMLLLSVYALGLGIPFLLIGLAFGSLSKWLWKINRYLGMVNGVSGLLILFTGVLIETDNLSFLASYGSFFDIGW